MAASLVPPMLDEGSVGNLIATLQRSLYPRPSQGFTVRLGILWALTGALILLALSYLLLHALRSKERPRWKSLWLVRVVERPGGSYVVMNCLPVWALSAVAYGVYELLYTGLFWRVYVLQRPQNVMNGFRSFDGPALFVCGWTISWSGLQSFLLATESDAFYLPSARLANALFVGGGLFLLVLNLGFAVATTVLADKIIQRYEDLLGALQALNERLAGRVPIPEDFLPIQAPAEAFARAAYNTRM
ncbi:uncharacterized protein JCM10292_003587 [Rhodotorula paludigena]|uniref:uncharacterized protein n=1 Tax=Rhodotorula paludigena TaxID=86838 RepID=UPI00316E2E37